MAKNSSPDRQAPLTAEQVFALGLHLTALANAQRKRIGEAASLVRRMARDGDSLREILDGFRGPNADPDKPEAIQRFATSCRELADAARSARSLIPPSASKTRGRDAVDGAPSTDLQTRRALADALVRGGRKVTAASFSGLAESVSIGPPAGKGRGSEHGRKAWDETVRRARARYSPKVPGTNRRKKLKRS